MVIDRDKLRELVADPKAKTTTIYRSLGITNQATFYYQLNKDPEAKRIFESRPGARAKPAKASAKAPNKKGSRGSKRASKKSAAAPPRKGNAKGASAELLNKIRLEFEHIEVYGAVSEHFDDLRAEVAALI